MLHEALVAEPATGRVFRGEAEVRLGDVDPDGRLRLDACARYLQDVSNDDTRDAALADDGSWVVRRTVVDVLAPLRFHERVSLATWCGGTGSRWAERRVSVAGSRGGRVETASLWVYVDLATFLPRRLGADFLALYGEAAGGRTVPSKLLLPPPDDDAVTARPWPLRRTDLDLLGHVNNAAYWCALEELVGDRPELLAGPHRAVVEFARQLDAGMAVELRWRDRPGSLDAWLSVEGTVHAALHLQRT
jgi:acyl-ACP thioesterase